MSYARRQEYRRLGRAFTASAGAFVAVLLALILAGGGALSLALLLALTAILLSFRAHRWLRLAARSSVGARSEAEVRRALAGLEVECWKVRHSLRWAARGDIDSLAIAPGGALLRSRPRPLGMRAATSRWCASRQRGCGASGEGGAAMALCPCCVWLAAAGSGVGMTACWSSRLVASFRRCARRVVGLRAWRCRSNPSVRGRARCRRRRIRRGDALELH